LKMKTRSIKERNREKQKWKLFLTFGLKNVRERDSEGGRRRGIVEDRERETEREREREAKEG